MQACRLPDGLAAAHANAARPLRVPALLPGDRWGSVHVIQALHGAGSYLQACAPETAHLHRRNIIKPSVNRKDTCHFLKSLKHHVIHCRPARSCWLAVHSTFLPASLHRALWGTLSCCSTGMCVRCQQLAFSPPARYKACLLPRHDCRPHPQTQESRPDPLHQGAVWCVQSAWSQCA